MDATCDSGDAERNAQDEVLEASEALVGETPFTQASVRAILLAACTPAAASAEEPTEEKEDVGETQECHLMRLVELSAAPEVAMFLVNEDAIVMLTSLAARSASTRLQELCFTILANLAIPRETCGKLAEDEVLCSIAMLHLLSSDHAPLLCEVLRLMATIGAHTGASVWHAKLLEVPNAVGAIVGMAENTLNMRLLGHALGVLQMALAGCGGDAGQVGGNGGQLGGECVAQLVGMLAGVLRDAAEQFGGLMGGRGARSGGGDIDDGGADAGTWAEEAELDSEHTAALDATLGLGLQLAATRAGCAALREHPSFLDAFADAMAVLNRHEQLRAPTRELALVVTTPLAAAAAEST